MSISASSKSWLVSNAAINTELYIFFQISALRYFVLFCWVLFFDKSSEVESLDHKAVPCLYIFEEPPYHFPQWPHQSAFPSTVREGSLSSASSPTLVICEFIDESHSGRYERISHCGFNLHCSDDLCHWTSSHVYWPSVCPLQMCLLRFSAYFLIGLFLFCLGVGWYRFFMNFVFNYLTDVSLANMSSLSFGRLSFHFVDFFVFVFVVIVLFSWAKTFSLM